MWPVQSRPHRTSPVQTAPYGTNTSRLSTLRLTWLLCQHTPPLLVQIMVDSRAEAVLVPIYGVMVPLHITTVRNVNHTAEQESSAAVIRLSLNFG